MPDIRKALNDIEITVDCGGFNTTKILHDEDIDKILAAVDAAGFVVVEKSGMRCTQCGWIVDTKSAPEFPK